MNISSKVELFNERSDENGPTYQSIGRYTFIDTCVILDRPFFTTKPVRSIAPSRDQHFAHFTASRSNVYFLKSNRKVNTRIIIKPYKVEEFEVYANLSIFKYWFLQYLNRNTLWHKNKALFISTIISSMTVLYVYFTDSNLKDLIKELQIKVQQLEQQSRVNK